MTEPLETTLLRAINKHKIRTARDEEMFWKGFLEACDWFAVWRDGVQRIGVQEIPLSEIRATIVATMADERDEVL